VRAKSNPRTPPFDLASLAFAVRDTNSPRSRPGCAANTAVRPTAPPLARKAIESIQIGDRVWAHDIQSNRSVPCKVTRLYRRTDRPTTKLTMVCEDRIGTRKTDSVRCTPDHPFWVRHAGWTPASRLMPGDELATRAGGSARVESVKPAGDSDVFNFEVAGHHNYFVSSAGVLVHNESSLPVAGPFEIQSAGISPAAAVAPRDVVAEMLLASQFTANNDVSFKVPDRADGARPTSIATIKGVPYVCDSRTPQTTRRYLENVISGRNYADEAELHADADAWERCSPAEQRLIEHTERALQDPDSPEFRQSAHMAHVARLILSVVRLGTSADSTLNDTTLRIGLAQGIHDPESAGPTSAVGTDRWSTSRDPAALAAYDMIIHRREGPWPLEQSAFGVELLTTAGLLWTKYDTSSHLQDFLEFRRTHRVDAVRTDIEGRRTHSLGTEAGMSLGNDPGVQELRARHLSIASGTSGTSSDAALLLLWAHERFGTELHAPGLSAESATLATKNLLLYFFRKQVVADGMSKQFNATGNARRNAGLPPMSVQRENVAVHTYGEISLGYELTLQRTNIQHAAAVARCAEKAAIELARVWPLHEGAHAPGSYAWWAELQEAIAR
jgi:hypothetical protein